MKQDNRCKCPRCKKRWNAWKKKYYRKVERQAVRGKLKVMQPTDEFYGE